MIKIALITGGSSGLGFEIAKKMVLQGMRVLLVSRSEEKLKKAIADLNLINDSLADSYSCDIGEEKSVNGLLEFVNQQGYQVCHLFNVAGMGKYNKIEEITQPDIDNIFSSNLIGVMLMCKTFVNHLSKSRDRGRIINVLSTAALKGKKMESIYYAAKWGARGFTESLKDELSDTKTEVITIYPGGMKTPFWDDSTSGYNTSVFMEPADVADVITSVALNTNVYISEITINRPKS